MPPLDERLQVDHPSPDVKFIRQLENQKLGTYLCFLDIGILGVAYWIAMRASVVIAVTIEIFATLIVTLGIFYYFRDLFTITTLKCTEYLVILTTILGLSSVFDLQNQVRLFNFARLKTEISQSLQVVRSLSIDDEACEAADIALNAEQRHEEKPIIDPHLKRYLDEKIATSRVCEIIKLARTGYFDTSVEIINDTLTHTSLSPFGFHDVEAALEAHAANLQEFQKLNSSSSDDQRLSMKVFGIVLVCFGIVLKVSRTTAEICKWHK